MKKTTSMIVVFEHDEGVDPSTWKFPKSMTGPKGAIAQIVGVDKVIEHASAERDFGRYSVTPIVTLQLDPGDVKAGIDMGNEDARKEFMASVFGENSDSFAEKIESLLGGKGGVQRITYVVNHFVPGEMVTSFEIGHDFELAEPDSNPEPVKDDGIKATVQGPIIVRLSAGQISEVGFPVGWTGPAVEIRDYDQGSTIKLSPNKPLPNGYAKDLVGVYATSTFTAAD